ncbi:MAG: 16S rRNA (cytosine(1402)-N(4))-methyltransferase RsmH [Clostridiales bacterium]|nr:16S rRNA (cytosine(1402)-N(4))-methyltransferase RsmH [Clostridiales bacterium]
MEFNHYSVMLNECIDNLNIRENCIYVDGTLGGAGHSTKIAERLNGAGLLIGIDQDSDAIEVASKRLEKFNNIKIVKNNNSNIKEILNELKISGVDGILVDLGVSSYQLDNGERGFSYNQDAKLDMRMDQENELTAEYIVNNYSYDDLVKILFEYGEENYSKKIAKKVCEYRENKKIETTLELVDIIKSSIGKYDDKHPAKRTFQALRIEVNGELRLLEKTVRDMIDVLNPKGRLCVITFHSLEDRIVKNVFNDYLGKCICPKNLPVCMCGAKPVIKLINKKPILPSQEELSLNSRSKSAKLRVIEKI